MPTQASATNLARLCFDGASKLPVFVLPTFNDRMAQNLPFERMAFGLAAYGHYLSASHTETGRAYTVAEPHLNAQALAAAADTNSGAFLSLPLFDSTPVRNSPAFIRLYAQFQADILNKGIRETLTKLDKHPLVCYEPGCD